MMRFLPHTDSDRKAMLDAIGLDSTDDLFAHVPKVARPGLMTELPHHQPEMNVHGYFQKVSNQNLGAHNTAFFVGGGVYNHHIPASVDHLIQRGEFLTAYTPYQPEISQGTLQAMFEFQTQVARLTGMEIANASLYDGSTACVEAMTMACRITKRDKVIISGGLHPHYADTAQTYADMTGFMLDRLPVQPYAVEDFHIDAETAAVVVQYPDFFGNINDYKALADKAHEQGALLIVVVTEIVSLGVLTPPADFDADIVAAEGQSIGVGMGFGGPHVGLMACKAKYMRQLPGRLVGETTDRNGQRGFVLTLATREQHIRRDKATSNICTNSGLCALAFSIHLSLLGSSGLKKLSQLNHAKAVQLKQAITAIEGVEVLNDTFFNEFVVRLNKPADGVLKQLAAKNILGGIAVSDLINGHDDLLLLAATELTTDDDIKALTSALQEIL